MWLNFWLFFQITIAVHIITASQDDQVLTEDEAGTPDDNNVRLFSTLPVETEYNKIEFSSTPNKSENITEPQKMINMLREASSFAKSQKQQRFKGFQEYPRINNNKYESAAYYPEENNIARTRLSSDLTTLLRAMALPNNIVFDGSILNRVEASRTATTPSNPNIGDMVHYNNPADMFSMHRYMLASTIATCLDIFSDNKSKTVIFPKQKCIDTISSIIFKPNAAKQIEIPARRQLHEENKRTTVRMLWAAQQQQEDEEHKKIKFFSWAGKRNSGTPKRLPFHSWGGKRANQVGTEKIQASRVPFNAWGGKRNINKMQEKDDEIEGLCCIHMTSNKLPYDPYKRSKAKFHSWGGKRTMNK